MYYEPFEIEFQVPDVEEQYITFELWVYGGWKMEEIGGGDMGECLVIQDMDYEQNNFSSDNQVFIKNWIDSNSEAIRKMFTERIKKYED